MINLVINNKKYSMPIRQSEISWALGKKISTIYNEYEKPLPIEGYREILSIMLGVNINIIELIDDNQLKLIVDNHVFFDENVKVLHNNYIKYKKKMYRFINLNELIVNKYSDLDLYCMEEDDEKLFFGLYEPVKWYDLKRYLLWIFIKNRKSIDEYNYFKIRIAQYLYMTYKKNKLDEYGLGSNKNIPENQTDGDIELTTLEKFGIYHVIMQHSDDDITKVLFWSQRNIDELFKYLAYMRIKSISNNK